MTKDWTQFEGQIVAGTFPLRRCLGGSATAATFLTELGEVAPQPVAIKLLPAAAEGAEFQLACWESITRLTHPHLLRVLQSGRCRLGDAEYLFVASEYAEENLAEVLSQRPLTLEEARQMLTPVAAALAYLHAQGLVHGRIKPANILARDDQVKLSVDSITPAGEPCSTFAAASPYDAPEVTAGGMLSPAADVWSLGMTLAEALTQRLPARDADDGADPPLPEAIPPEVRDVILGCLRRDPQQRWTMADLAAWLGHPATSVRPASVQPRERHSSVQAQPPAAPPARSSRAPASPRAVSRAWRYVLPAAIVLALAAVIAVPMLLDRSGEEEPRPEAAAEQSAPQPQKTSASAGGDRPSAPRNAAVPAAPVPAAGAPASGEAAGEVLRRVSPDVSRTALDTIRGTVRVVVKVSVDASGRVVDASLEAPGPSRYFADRSLEAARRWEFRAPHAAGRPIASEWLLQFDFSQSGAEATSSRVEP